MRRRWAPKKTPLLLKRLVAWGFVFVAVASASQRRPRSSPPAPPAVEDPYRELGVAPTASDDEIKRSYRAKALAVHPDKGGDAETFKRLNAAYELLKDPAKRKAFDETRRTAAYRTAAAPHASSSAAAQEIRVAVKISLESVLRGGSYTVPVSIPISPFSSVVYLLPVVFGPGVRDGDVLLRRRAPGLGDVVAYASWLPHRSFTPRGDDLHCVRWISRFRRRSTRRVTVRPLDAPPWPLPCRRKVTIEVDGTPTARPRGGRRRGGHSGAKRSAVFLRDGTRLRAKGWGLPRSDGSRGRGDVVVMVKVRSRRTSLALEAARLSPLGLAAWAACHRSAALFLLKRSWGLVLGGLFGGKDAASASGESGTKRERGPARLLPGLAQLLSLAVTALRLVEDLARLNVAADDQSRRRPFSGSSPLWGEAAAAAASSSEGTGSPSMSSSWSRGKTTSPPGSVSSKGAAFFSWGAPVWRHLR